MRKTFALIGGFSGLGLGLFGLVVAYMSAPSAPGLTELLVQAVILGVLAACGGAVGYVIGLIVDLIAGGREQPPA